jgi:hypothetical protein
LISSFGLEDFAVNPFMDLRFILAPASEYPLTFGLMISLTLTTSYLVKIKAARRRKETKLRPDGR